MKFIGSDKPVLVVEDFNLDVEILKIAFKELKIQNVLVVAKNDEEGIDYLTDDSNESPCLIMIDLAIPRMGGFHFLTELKEHQELSIIRKS